MKFLEDGEYRAEVHYILHLHRRPIYYITVIVAPTFLISSLSVLGIFSPGSNDGPRSEKVSLGLGSLLAMTVLLDIVSAAMPKSNSIPLLGYYIISVIALNAIGVGLSMGLLAISRHLIQQNKLPTDFTYKCMRMVPRRPEQQRDFSIIPRGSLPPTETPIDPMEVARMFHGGNGDVNTPMLTPNHGLLSADHNDDKLLGYVNCSLFLPACSSNESSLE